MSRPNDLSRSFSPFDQQRTLVVVIEMSQSSWLVSGIVPGVDRQPLKKLDPDENALLRLLQRWRGEAEGRGASVERTVVAFEAGRDGFWLARWLRSRGIEAHVLHSSSVAVALNVFVPIANAYAGPLIDAQLVAAMPDRPSLAVHAMSTFASTV